MPPQAAARALEPRGSAAGPKRGSARRPAPGRLGGAAQHLGGELRLLRRRDGPHLPRRGRAAAVPRPPRGGCRRGSAAAARPTGVAPRRVKRRRTGKRPAERGSGGPRGGEPAGRWPRLPRARPGAHRRARNPLAPAGTGGAGTRPGAPGQRAALRRARGA